MLYMGVDLGKKKSRKAVLDESAHFINHQNTECLNPYSFK